MANCLDELVKLTSALCSRQEVVRATLRAVSDGIENVIKPVHHESLQLTIPHQHGSSCFHDARKVLSQRGNGLPRVNPRIL